MLPLLLKLYVGRLREAGAPLHPRIESELKNHFDYMSAALGKDDYFVANMFSAADIQLSFVLDAGASRGPLAGYPNLVALHARIEGAARIHQGDRARRTLRARPLAGGLHAAAFTQARSRTMTGSCFAF